MLVKVIDATMLSVFLLLSSFFNFCWYFISLILLNFSRPCFLSCPYFLGKSQPDVSYQGCSCKKAGIPLFFDIKQIKIIIKAHFIVPPAK